MGTDLWPALEFGAGQPERFLSAWHGPSDRDAPASGADSGMPIEVVRWQQTVSRWDAALRDRQNVIPQRAERDGDVLLVGVENQQVWFWGIRDPREGVLERYNAPGEPWTPTAESLEEYLWHFLLMETVLSAAHPLSISGVSVAVHQEFVTGWQQLPVRPWRFPGAASALWYRDDALAFTCSTERAGTPLGPDATYVIFVAGRDADALTRIDRLGLIWDMDEAGPGGW